MSDDEMYEGIEEIVDGYIKEGKNLKEIYREVFDSFKTAEDKVINDYHRRLYNGENLTSERMMVIQMDCMLMSGQRLGMEKILMINDAYEKLTKSDEEDEDDE